MIGLFIVFTCDAPKCRTRLGTPERTNHRKARRYARRKGWECGPRNGDWCPWHVKEDL